MIARGAGCNIKFSGASRRAYDGAVTGGSSGYRRTVAEIIKPQHFTEAEFLIP